MRRLNLTSGLLGILFGCAFAGANLNQYDTIHAMLSLRDIHPYLIMATSIATAAPILILLERRRFKTSLGGPIRLQRWSPSRNHLSGGIIFGAGWAISGACPGSAATALGAGSLCGFILIAGMMTGIRLRDIQVSRVISPASESISGIEPATN